MRPPSISFFFPCYNDACTIASLVLMAHRKLEAFTPDFEVLVVDDGSQDRSLSVFDIRDVDCDFRIVRRSFLDKLDLRSTTGAICIELAKKEDPPCRPFVLEVNK